MGTRHTAAGPPWVVWTCSAILPQDCTACTQSLHSMGRVPGELWGTWAPWATCSWSGKWATWTVAGARTMRATRATRASTPYTPGGPVPTMSCTCSLHAWPLLSRLCVPVCVAFCIAKSLPCHEFPVFPCVSCLAARAGLHTTLFHLRACIGLAGAQAAALHTGGITRPPSGARLRPVDRSSPLTTPWTSLSSMKTICFLLPLLGFLAPS